MPNQSTARIGSTAPAFSLPSTVTPESRDGRVALSDFVGQWLILMFYPRDFSLVCPTELIGFDRILLEFQDHGTSVVAVSCDGVASHERWQAMPRSEGGVGPLRFPLASDEDGVVARAYGVYQDDQKVPQRALFIIDPHGILQYMVVHNMNVGRRTEEVIRVLSALQTGGLTCEGWSPGNEIIDPTEWLKPGQILSHYQIEAELGSGAFATVYRAQDLHLHRRVALKVLKNPRGVNGRTALSEARAAARLNHPRVCTIFGVEDADGASIIAMEYVDGLSLNKYVCLKPSTVEVRADLARQIAQGMSDAHEHGVTHGDLKPSNVLVNKAGRVKIVDFGLSRIDLQQEASGDSTLDVGSSDEGSVTGTPNYMSPEQAAGELATPASDVFSLGLILFELLTGKKPIGGRNVLQVLNAIRTIDAEALAAQVPPAYRPLVARMLANDPARRTVRMAEIVESLERIGSSPAGTRLVGGVA